MRHTPEYLVDQRARRGGKPFDFLTSLLLWHSHAQTWSELAEQEFKTALGCESAGQLDTAAQFLEWATVSEGRALDWDKLADDWARQHGVGE